MSIIAPDGWYDLAKRLPKGLSGALEPGGREDGNGIIPTNFHGLDFEVVSEFDLIVEHESCEERDIGEDGTVGWIVDKVLRAWLEGFDFYRHLVISGGRVFWFNPETNPEKATLLVDVWNEENWRVAQTRLDSAVRLIAYEKVRRWVSSTLNFLAVRSRRCVVTSMEKRSEECTEYMIWDKEYCHPIKIITVYAFGRIDMRSVIHEEPDTLEFCPGGRPTGLSSESEDAIKALLNRVEASLETD